ncbi:hypothetical protein ACFFMN_23730 [Planobispora siamensis]|uniref:Uncharacterized protein n=1 Tax=Planobispora siamensis TaxID=936338 RepID=A0A8J3STK4_9ACTN|nr:hypothetical protein [Planobispora siamensis]GIH95368.1 hypothetical protein Psi01_59980 [Planobispora siamensis]
MTDEQQPELARLTPVGDEGKERVRAEYGDLGDPRNPLAIAMEFFSAVVSGTRPDVEYLQVLCTPESWGQWDFDDMRRDMATRGVASRVEVPANGDPTVRFVKFVEVEEDAPMSTAQLGGLAKALILTLHWRPEADRWMVYAYGAVPPGTIAWAAESAP